MNDRPNYANDTCAREALALECAKGSTPRLWKTREAIQADGRRGNCRVGPAPWTPRAAPQPTKAPRISGA